MQQSEKIFSPDGLLSEHLEDFRYRPQQQEMSAEIESALEHGSRLIIEAGTGVGKTFAYLVPALLSEQKVIISTGTRHLQDQLYFKDLPAVLDIVKKPVSTALLKGRANYLCLYRLKHHVSRTRVNTGGAAEKAQIIRNWSQVTKTGEIAEVNSIGEGDPIWPAVTSTVENCLSTECPDFEDCHVFKAREKAQGADIVVVNHHLFFSDLILKQADFGNLLPQVDACILDEAHQLPELASDFLATTTSSYQINNLLEDIVAAQVEEVPQASDLRDLVDTVKKRVAEFRLALAKCNERTLWQEAIKSEAMQEGFAELCESLDRLFEELSIWSDCGKVLSRCKERCEMLQQQLRQFSEIEEDVVSWVERFEKGFKLHSTPLMIAEMFQALMQSYQCSWIFTSATLTMNERFDHFQQQLGLGEADTLLLDSPFDFEASARLFLPSISVDPGNDDYTQLMLDAVLPVLQANRGRAFMLFSSHRALQLAAHVLRTQDEFNLLVQGEAPRRELLDRFVKTEQAVLLGASSFWEGVDIRGSALSCVVIDKLPFAAPDDPVLAGRLQALRRMGVNPFMFHQLPQAVIALKQGVGRLIRDEGDYGVVALCDPRLTAKSYGKTFINSLPDMPVTSSLDEVIHFLFRQEESGHEISCN